MSHEPTPPVAPPAAGTPADGRGHARSLAASVGRIVVIGSSVVFALCLVLAALALGRIGSPFVVADEAGAQVSRPLLGDAVLGGERVSAQRLERGRALYQRYCLICHGERGDGLGPSAPYQWPPPRDFRSAQFKFAGASDGALATDEELVRIVRHGLRGTAMQPWDLPTSELLPVIDYIKSFSPEGQGYRDPARQPVAPVIPADPYRGEAEVAAAVSLGERLYHATFQCNQCHPSYVSEPQIEAWGAPTRTTSPLLPVAKWSATYRSVLLPPDFLRHPLRSIRLRPATEGATLDHDPVDLYRIIAYGMNGPMPGYGHLGAREIWAVVHYTKMLADLRDSSAAHAMRAKLAASASEMP